MGTASTSPAPVDWDERAVAYPNVARPPGVARQLPSDRPTGPAAYQAHARHYDQRTRTFQHWRELLIRALAAKPGDTVVDVGCGTGLCLSGLQAKVGPTGAIIGIDSSRDMLDIAAKRVAENGWCNVQLVSSIDEVSAGETPIEVIADAAVFCAVHDVMQSPATLRKVFDRLRPGAAVAAIGGKWPAPWLWPLRPWVANLHAPFITDFGGFDKPWRHLVEQVPELRVRQLGAGTGYLAFGRTPE